MNATRSSTAGNADPSLRNGNGPRREAPAGGGSGGAHPGDAGIPTYYGEPPIKASHYGWMVAGYVFLAGLAGAAQVLAALAMLVPEDPRADALIGDARYLALVATLAGAALLIADLKTPRRWANMLRLVRWTSPMSIGSWFLTTFGALTTLTVIVQLLVDLGLIDAFPRVPGLLLQWGTALFGMLMCTYTAPLLSSTSTPLWAGSPGLLAAGQASFALASGVSALTLTRLVGDSASRHPALTSIGLLAELAALLFTLLWAARLANRGLAEALGEGRFAATLWLGVVVFGLLLPIGLYTYGMLTSEPGSSPSPLLSAIAALAGLTGSLLWRWLVIEAGNSSAGRAKDYFRFTGSLRPNPHTDPRRSPSP